jgi:hypothetical protein
MFHVTGGGSYCEGGSGVEVGISGSQVGNNYILWNGMMPVSAWIPGTGSPLSFGLQTLPGYYWVLAANASTNCTGGMLNIVTITIDTPLPVSVAISASANPVNAGDAVTLSAIPTNGGNAPIYQWMVNGMNVGTGSAAYTYNPVNQDVVTCVLTSNAYCVSGNPASSNAIVMTVDGVAANITVTGTVANGETKCYNATQTLTVAGGGTTFTVQTGGSATMIAGQNIIYLPGSIVMEGGYMHGYISTDNLYCGQQATLPAVVTTATGEGEETAISLKSAFILYPNPTNGNFTLVQKSGKPCDEVTVEIYSIQGERVMTGQMIGEQKHDFIFSGMNSGLYFVKIVARDYIQTIKLVKTR